jgi:hypothetical protein
MTIRMINSMELEAAIADAEGNDTEVVSFWNEPVVADDMAVWAEEMRAKEAGMS